MVSNGNIKNKYIDSEDGCFRQRVGKAVIPADS